MHSPWLNTDLKLMQPSTLSVFSVVATVTVYEKDGVTVTLSCEKQSDSGLTVTLTASNSTESDIRGFTLQAAVPKVCISTSNKILLIIH